MFYYICSASCLGIIQFVLRRKSMISAQFCFMSLNFVKMGPNNQKQVWDDSVNECTAQWWFEKHWKGDFRLEGKEGSGKIPSLDVLRALVKENPRIVVRKLAENLLASKLTGAQHLKTVKKLQKLETWVPQALTGHQKKSPEQSLNCISSQKQKQNFSRHKFLIMSGYSTTTQTFWTLARQKISSEFSKSTNSSK